MAGEIQLNSTTFATESGGTITIDNVDSATNRTNLGLGSMATQNADAVALTGGSLTGTEIDLKSSGDTIYASNGTTALLSESGGTVTLGNATLASSVKFTDEYYLQGVLHSDQTVNSSGSMINFDSSTQPYWILTGDTTNFIQGTLVTDLKILKSGIYLVNFSLTGKLSSDTERFLSGRIRGVGSNSTNELARADGGVISSAESGNTADSVSSTLVRKFSANDEINFFVFSGADGNVEISGITHFNICLIRPL